MDTSHPAQPNQNHLEPAQSQSRRTFIKTVATGAAAVSVSLNMPAVSYARILGANDRINIGMIGTGRIGRSHINGLLNNAQDEATIVALCDVYEPNLAWAQRRVPGAKSYKDFREVIAQSDIDAVFVTTPDHWHALPTVMACQAGKDVYVEKPSSLAIKEGRKMVDAARTHGRIVQVGTQQRSQRHFQEAVALVRSGKLGDIAFVRCWNYGNSYPEGVGDPSNSTPPDGLDWDMWLGPAPWRTFNINRFGVVVDEKGEYQRWASFRWFWDYAGGMMTDWGVHLLDIVQWAMDEDYPETVSAAGGKFFLQDNRETPDTITATYRYPNFICTYENRNTNSLALHGHGYGIMFHGTKGTLLVDRDGYEVIPEGKSDLKAQKQGQIAGPSHHQNFFDSMRSRKLPICDIETGHRSSSTAILGNIAYRTGHQIDWDGKREAIHNDEAASRLLDVTYRAPWKL